MASLVLCLVIVWGSAAATQTNFTQEPLLCGNGDVYRGFNTDVYFKKEPVDDFIFKHAVISKEPAMSKIHCGRKCVRTQECVMYTFQPIQNTSSGRCRLYKRFLRVKDDTQTTPGARSYAVNIAAYASFDNGYSLVAGRCIQVLNETMNYQNATQRCKDLDNGHLFFAKTVDDINFGKRILKEHGIGGMWVGADKLKQGDDFQWLDGTSLPRTSSLWQEGEPDDTKHDCACLRHKQGKLTDCHCRKSRKFYVACQRDI